MNASDPAVRRLRRATWAWAGFQGGRDPLVILLTIYVFVPYVVTGVPAAGMARAGRASGLGLALGNLVSVVTLAFVLWAFALPGKVPAGLVPAHPLFSLDAAAHEPDRIVPVVVAGLLALGTLPLLRWVPDVARTAIGLGRALRLGIADLRVLVAEARGHRDARTYLGARLLFTDGLTGILVFAGVYAAGAMGWRTVELLAYGLILCCFAVVGGLLAGWLDTRVGPKHALQLEIAGVIASQLLSLGNTRDRLFYASYDPATHPPLWPGELFATAPELGLIACGMLAAVTVTAAYASSRTMLTRVAPPDKIGVFFGLFVIAGAATAWLAPLLVQLATLASGSQRIGLLPLSALLLAGWLVLRKVEGSVYREPASGTLVVQAGG